MVNLTFTIKKQKVQPLQKHKKQAKPKIVRTPLYMHM